MIIEDENVIDEEDEDANLTDAEREAMNLDLDEEETPEPDAEDEDEGEEEAEPTTEDESVVEEDEEQNADPEPEPEEEPEPLVAKQEVSPEPELDAFKEAVTGIDEQIKALRTKFSDGEIDTDDYLEQRDALKDQKQDLVWEQREATVLHKAEVQAAAKQDQTNLSQAIGDFYTANPEYGKSKGLQGALDAHWQDVYNESAWQNKSYLARMNEAKRRTDDELGRTTAPAPKPAPTKEDDLAAKRALTKGRGQQVAPQSLADAPTADESDNEGGKYADLEKAEGTDLEVLIAQKISQHGEEWLDGWLSSDSVH